MDAALLKYYMTINNCDLGSLAKYLGISRQTLHSRMLDTTEFKKSEIAKIKKKFSLAPDEVDRIFFKELVSL